MLFIVFFLCFLQFDSFVNVRFTIPDAYSNSPAIFAESTAGLKPPLLRKGTKLGRTADARANFGDSPFVETVFRVEGPTTAVLHGRTSTEDCEFGEGPWRVS